MTPKIRYYPFGADRYTSGSTPTSFKYTGQRQKSAIGLYYYGARWYDPALGRFVQPDTIVPDPGSAASYDRYAYVANNPLKYADPTGHEPCSTGNWGDCFPGSKASTNPYRGERRRAIVRHGRALADNPQLTSLEKFAQLTEYASQFYGEHNNYSATDYDNYVHDISFVITGWDQKSCAPAPCVGLQALGLGDVAADGQWLGTNVFSDFSGWASAYNDYNPERVTRNNQMYHFWFYVYSSFYDGPMAASFGNKLHETHFPEVHPRITEQNRGISQADSDLGVMGVQLGSLLNASSYVTARGISPGDPHLSFSMITPATVGQWLRYNLGNQGGPH